MTRRRAPPVFDWRASDAHRLLLADFVCPQDPASYTTREWWRSALGESPDVAIARFKSEGFLVEPTLDVKVERTFTAAELKAYLKAQGLKVSGRKSALATRLAAADPKGMRKIVSDQATLICSETGMELANQIRAALNAEKEQAEQDALIHLLARRFVEAGQCVINYESKQVFQRGVGIDWKKVDPARYATTLKAICGGRPKILSRLSDLHIHILAIGAAMMELWGTGSCDKWLPPGFHIDLHMDNSAAARMILFFAQNRFAIDDYRRSGVVEYVEVSGAGDPSCCDACRKILRKYTFDDVPEIPHVDCTNPMGCRCCILGVTRLDR
jgi:hypothetical protein